MCKMLSIAALAAFATAAVLAGSPVVATAAVLAGSPVVATARIPGEPGDTNTVSVAVAPGKRAISAAPVALQITGGSTNATSVTVSTVDAAGATQTLLATNSIGGAVVPFGDLPREKLLYGGQKLVITVTPGTGGKAVVYADQY